MQTVETDFLIIGSGIAGLTIALRAAKYGRVLVVTKSEIAESNTRWAQGGIAAAVGEDDSWGLHEQDTLTAGAGLCDKNAVRFLVQNAVPCLQWLIDNGAHFDLSTQNGFPHLSLGREGGHSRNRIVRRADQSGWEIERALINASRQQPNITIREFTFVESLLLKGSRCCGAVARPERQDAVCIQSRAAFLATGSCCQVYRYTTNPPIATGDGIGLATAVGAEIKNMEFIQFHPTTLYSRTHRSFLISEAVRGEGAILRNVFGRRFMFDYDPRGELAPRDIVARAIHAEAQKTGSPFVHLDMTHIPPAELQRRFPNILETLKEAGIDATRDPVPVVPAAHYQCGGVVTDLNGKTNVDGLYAAGEVACTGVHGANRLASNSLLEALVFGFSAAEHAAGAAEPPKDGKPARNSLAVVPHQLAEGVLFRLKRLMWEHVGIVRRTHGLEFAKHELEEMMREMPVGEPFFVRGAQTANMLVCANWIIQQALARKQNVGLHYNADLDTPSETRDASSS